MPLKPTVIARRWDGIGGRLYAILNAWSIARALGLDFRFIWPRGVSTGLDDPAELFSRDFLDKYEISSAACVDRPWISFRSPDVNTPDPFDSAPPDALIEIAQCFRILALKDETSEVARERFLRDFLAVDWAPEIITLIDEINKHVEIKKYCAIHIRSGDIVFGDWRQFLPTSKYLPTAYFELIINHLGSSEHILLVSDNINYVNGLKERFNSVYAPEDIIQNYRFLTEAQKMFADIVLLASSRIMFAPAMSAFSQISKDLGPTEMGRIDELITHVDIEHELRVALNKRKLGIFYNKNLKQLIARDICWYLDVFSNDIASYERFYLARRAVRLDANYCGALNRWALALAMSGRRNAAEKAVARALLIAAAAKTHDDPLVESLATAVAVKAIACIASHPAKHALWERICPPLAKIRTTGDYERLASMKLDVARCERLLPYQIQMDDVLVNLRYLIAASEWVIKSGARYRRMISTHFFATEADDVVTSSWRAPGMETLSESDNFPQVLRNIELVTIRMVRAIGAAIAHGSRPSSPGMSHIDGVKRSSSGLAWITGWAHNINQNGNGRAVGWAPDGKIVSGGPIFLRRPDVADAIKSPLAELSGFILPIPASNGHVEDAESRHGLQVL